MSTETQEVQRHNAYGWIRPDAIACYLCGRKEFATPVDGFSVRNCGKCDRPVCQNCAETDADCVGDPPRFVLVQWQCAEECLIDVRVPVTVTFDLSLENVKPGEVEEAIRKLESAVLSSDLEKEIAHEFVDEQIEVGYGSRWNAGSADMSEVGIRTHARSGQFSALSRSEAANV